MHQELEFLLSSLRKQPENEVAPISVKENNEAPKFQESNNPAINYLRY